ncbi:MAG: hypothetical protein JW807_11045 [Spirochaetes bacterium]|nr:hypothetical protein [Spirochaetota bacterium]
MNLMFGEPSPGAKAIIMSAAAAVVAAVGYLDYITGEELSPQLFYPFRRCWRTG